MAGKKEGGTRGAFVIFRSAGDVVHTIHWYSRELKRVPRSSSTAQILAPANALDMALDVRCLLRELAHDNDVKLATDSRSFFKLATTTKEPEEAQKTIDLAAIRRSFEKGQLGAVVWSPRYYVVADALTKDSPTRWPLPGTC